MLLSLAGLIAAIKGGSITADMIETIRYCNANAVQYPEIHRALKSFDAGPFALKVLDQIGSSFDEKYNMRRRHTPMDLGPFFDVDLWKLTLVARFISESDITLFGVLMKETCIVAELGAAFLAADLPLQSASVYVSLINNTDEWLYSRKYRGSDYTAFDWEKEFFVWGEGLTRAVERLNSKIHGPILKRFQEDLAGDVSMQPLIMSSDRDGPLTACRQAVRCVLAGYNYPRLVCTLQRNGPPHQLTNTVQDSPLLVYNPSLGGIAINTCRSN